MIERHEPDERQRLARVVVDILRPVPVGKVTVRARTVRRGRRVALHEAITEADGQEVLHTRGWRIALNVGEPAAASPAPGPPGALEVPDGRPLPAFFDGRLAGYLSAIEWRFLSAISMPGNVPACGASPTIPLIPHEEPSSMGRALLVADSGSGVSPVLDPASKRQVRPCPLRAR